MFSQYILYIIVKRNLFHVIIVCWTTLDNLRENSLSLRDGVKFNSFIMFFFCLNNSIKEQNFSPWFPFIYSLQFSCSWFFLRLDSSDCELGTLNRSLAQLVQILRNLLYFGIFPRLRFAIIHLELFQWKEEEQRGRKKKTFFHSPIQQSYFTTPCVWWMHSPKNKKQSWIINLGKEGFFFFQKLSHTKTMIGYTHSLLLISLVFIHSISFVFARPLVRQIRSAQGKSLFIQKKLVFYWTTELL